MNRIGILVILAVFSSCYGFSVRQARNTGGQCSADLSAATGSITSPGYPGQYPNSQTCNYKITVQAGKVIKLTFTKFALENDSYCSYDSLKIIDGTTEKKYCGSTLPPPYTSKSNSLLVKFESDISITDAGFVITYQTLDDTSKKYCNATLTATTGTVSSPEYPNKYPNNQDCMTKIQVQSGKIIQVTFQKFALEGGSSCPYDYLRITDGSQVKTFCGTRVPATYNSITNSITLHFKSDHVVTDAGYTCTYKAVDAPPPTPKVPANVNGADCGKVKVQQSRVIGGSNAKKGSWPWQIGIFTSSDRFFCGGSIISPRWIVTASHCLAGTTPESIYIKAGDWDLYNSDGTEQKRDVEKIVMHPKYDLYGKINYDIALMKLKNPLTFNDFVNAVCIPDKTNAIAVNSSCYITGWGKIKHPGSVHPILQQAMLPVMESKVCQAKLDKMNWGLSITDKMVCAGAEDSVKSGCHGDSGGPYVCEDKTSMKYVLHGAVSWGSPRCNTTDAFSVFARVQALREWMNVNLNLS